VARYAKAVIPQARVSGAVLVAIHRRKQLWQELTPSVSKRVLAGDGAATKVEMVAAACQRLNLPSGDIRKHRGKVWAHASNGTPLLSEDDADAIALGVAGLAIKVERGGA
jgi:Holliday junction resolvasome RuvABC endonuclease subunit